jgi:hypothetical protein
MGRFIMPTAAAKVVVALGRRPQRVARGVGELGGEPGQVVAWRSELAPAKGDRRFADAAWNDNWLLRRVLQAYHATVRTAQRGRTAAGRRRPALALRSRGAAKGCYGEPQYAMSRPLSMAFASSAFRAA